MGFGLQAIGTTTRGAAKEIITNGLNGFLVPPADASMLSVYLIELAKNREHLQEMSLGGS